MSHRISHRISQRARGADTAVAAIRAGRAGGPAHPAQGARGRSPAARAWGAIAILAALVLLFAAAPMRADTMRMAVTTSFANSGLADVLLPRIEKDTGIEVQLLIVGTGQALRLGAAGDVDAVLVHARAAEERFIAEGHGTHRREIMYNDFVLLGPKADPAGLADAPDAPTAMRRIAAAGESGQAVFVSRGDDSGTNKRELALWAEAGLPSPPEAPWYRASGQGMGATLNIAAAMNAHTLSDRASWLFFANKGDLAILFAGDPRLRNQYAYIPVNPARHPHVKHDLALKLEQWLLSDTARALIDGYRIGDVHPFTYNAQP